MSTSTSDDVVKQEQFLLESQRVQAETRKKVALELSPTELKEVADAAVATTEESESYLAAHPELQEIIANFAKACLESKPDNVIDFAVKYFEEKK